MQLRNLTIVTILAAGSAAHGVILQSSANRNTTEPAGALAGSGWQYQGTWRGFNGTPISKKYFITAGHVEGDVGTKFRINGRVFTTTAMWDDPASDLRIYSVNKKFDAWAPIYTGTKEVGKHALVIGRGTQRGAEVRLNNVLKGWEWGGSDGVQSWGLNQIDTILNGDPDEGQLLQFDFDSSGNGAIDNEATLSNGDSAGGVFIYNKPTKRWELAGINLSVDGPFARTNGGQTFQAALTDLGGFFYGSTQVNDTFVDNPSRFFSTRVSSNLDWINGVLGGKIAASGTAGRNGGNVPEPAGMIALAAAAALLRRRR